MKIFLNFKYFYKFNKKLIFITIIFNFRFAIKSSILAGVCYVTVEEGLWSSPEESAKFYNKLYNNISPLIQKNVPQEVIQEVCEYYIT